MNMKTIEEHLQKLHEDCSKFNCALDFVPINSDTTDETEYVRLDKMVSALATTISDLQQIAEMERNTNRLATHLQEQFLQMEDFVRRITEEVESQVENGSLALATKINSDTSEKPKVECTGSTAVLSKSSTQHKENKIVEVQHVTEEELNKISQYMRGRIKLNSINEFIDKFNIAITRKYQLMNKPRKTLTGNEKKLLSIYKSQETNVCKGHIFCTDDDLKQFASISMNNSLKSILTIVRHCTRIKEIREPQQVLRYAVIK